MRSRHTSPELPRRVDMALCFMAALICAAIVPLVLLGAVGAGRDGDGRPLPVAVGAAGLAIYFTARGVKLIRDAPRR